jgi:pyruvate-ferredoxin/flavodoxin oxidoreductase
MGGRGKPNLWGQVPRIVEMQSEGGVAGAVHGGLLGGALTTTFTASQGLLLMIPNLYKIAGRAASVHDACQRPHACGPGSLHLRRPSGRHGMPRDRLRPAVQQFRQEAHDFALIAHAASYRSRVPFIHFFDGFRTSHEVSKLTALTDANIREHHRREGPGRIPRPRHDPRQADTARHGPEPDVYFQGREAVNRFYAALPKIVQDTMDRFAAVTGRSYHLFDYHGHPEAERVIVAMGSSVETIVETVDWLVAQRARRSASSRSACSCRSTSRPSSRRFPSHRQGHRRPGPHEGAGLHRRAAVPERAWLPWREGAGPLAAPPRSSAAATGSAPRNSPRAW